MVFVEVGVGGGAVAGEVDGVEVEASRAGFTDSEDRIPHSRAHT